MVKPCPPQLTVKCVDTYCELYRDLFVEVRAYEAFKYLHLERSPVGSSKFSCPRKLVNVSSMNLKDSWRQSR